MKSKMDGLDHKHVGRGVEFHVFCFCSKIRPRRSQSLTIIQVLTIDPEGEDDPLI